jgi:hypothetical protein
MAAHIGFNEANLSFVVKYIQNQNIIIWIAPARKATISMTNAPGHPVNQ